jgi:signal transduction histidine kinase
MNRPDQPELRGSASLVGFLVLALVIAAVLAYQAQDAARSHRDTAERALTEYASLAAEQFAHHAHMSLTALQMMSLRGVVALDQSPSAEPLLSVEEFQRSARELSAWCECLDTGVVFVRLDHRTGAISTAGDAPTTLDRWRELLAIPDPTEIPDVPAWGRAPLRDDRLAFYTFAGPRATVLHEEGDRRSKTVLSYHVRDADGTPVSAYGYEVASETLVASMFRRLVEEAPLLPRSLLGDLANESVLAITVRDPEGSEIFRSPGVDRSDYVAAHRLDAPWDDFVAQASLRPEAAGTLIIGGLPASRLPLLLSLLGLTAALMIGALVQLHRHQELVRTRANFVAGVSHELRTPLTQIRLYADLLRSGRLSEENRERSVRVIDQEARRLSHLVENILRFSSAGAATSRLQAEPRQLVPLVREILQDFEPLARSRRAEFRLELDPEARAAVDVDALRQVLLNLLDNAVKYGPPGQEVVVGLHRRTGTVEIRVDDQGPGVPSEARDLIWEPYRRLDAAVESGTGGSGIGLSVVREIAELHGGRARVTDAPGGGARFVVELPALAPRSATEREMETV